MIPVFDEKKLMNFFLFDSSSIAIAIAIELVLINKQLGYFEGSIDSFFKILTNIL